MNLKSRLCTGCRQKIYWAMVVSEDPETGELSSTGKWIPLNVRSTIYEVRSHESRLGNQTFAVRDRKQLFSSHLETCPKPGSDAVKNEREKSV